ncbi:hypothetical protein PC113_g8818 [Phytophthora cactorum]|uniref:DDE-1 domain-containing protein n=1 Tax=Phytophthora cactorum TaxID=29920 RepID=A0A8T0ZB96_9STRA|nr:hypothetical protein PC113_g8818 [Phytophthora cactorum]
MLPRDFGQFKLIWSIRQVQVENFTPSCNSTGHTLELKFQHGPEEGRVGVSLTSCGHLRFLPPNLTSSAQPLDSGTIRSFKARYRRCFVQWCLDAIEGGIKRKLKVPKAIHINIDSWAGVSSDCIRSCWVQSRIVDARLLGEIRQAGEYVKTADQVVVDDIVSMLAGVNVHESVEEYLEIDSDADVHEPQRSTATTLQMMIRTCDGNTLREQATFPSKKCAELLGGLSAQEFILLHKRLAIDGALGKRSSQAVGN